MIFFDNARKYWDAGLSVIPITKPNPGGHAGDGKRPAISTWQTFSDQKVPVEAQTAWLEQFPEHNIGLVLGAASGLVALDIDTDDPRIVNAIESVTPDSPWVRYGQKGYVKLFKFPREYQQRIFHIKLSDGLNIVDFLSTGSQVVLPPSIHPKTMQPYHASCELLDVLDAIPDLPADYEALLREALLQVGIVTAQRGSSTAFSDYVPAGGRDNALVRFAGGLVHDIFKGRKTLKETLDIGNSWVTDRVEKVYGDELPPAKMTEKIVEWLRKDLFGAKKLTLPGGWDDDLAVEQLKAMGLDDIGVDQRRFNYEEISDFFNDKIQGGTIERGSHKMMELIEVVCQRMAGNVEITKLQEDQLLRYVAQSSGGSISVVAMRKRISDLQKGEIAGNDHSELARAVLEEFQRTGEVRHHNQELFQWQGAYWVPIDEMEIIKKISADYGHFPAARKAGDHIGIMKTVKTLTSTPLQSIAVHGINFVNGYLTEDLVLRPHDKEYGCTYVLPYPYRPDLAGKATMFQEMLQFYWGHHDDFNDKVEALQEAFAATMFGLATSYFRVFCLYGVSGTGKSRILNIMEGLMPPGCSSAVPPQRWSSEFDVVEIADKVLNIAGELGERDVIPGAIFKQVSEGASITAGRKYQQKFKFRPKAAHWFASNHPPRTDDSSTGFTRRWLFFTFDKKIDGNITEITDFDKVILEQEREAVAAWAVQGLIRLKALNKYTVPASSREIEVNVENGANSVRFFLASLQNSHRLLMGAGAEEMFTPIEPVYAEYRNFCAVKGGVSPVALQTFTDRMGQLPGQFGFQVVLNDPQPGSSGKGQGVKGYSSLTLVTQKPRLVA